MGGWVEEEKKKLSALLVNKSDGLFETNCLLEQVSNSIW